MGTMTPPASAPRYSQPGRLPGGLHYSWVIVGILVVVQVIGSAISQSAGVMVSPLRDPHGDFGWGIGTIGVLMAVYDVVGALFAPVSGWLGERYGARCLMLAGGLLYGGSMFLLGLVRQPWHFLLAFSLLLALTQSICMVPLMASVSDWFRRRLGLGTGILWAAGGLGAALLAPLVSYLLDQLGWQGTFWSIGSRLLTPIVAERSGGKPIMAAALLIQGLTVLVLFRAHDVWTFYLFGSLFGLGFGGEMSAYLVVNRQYFGAGPTSTLYGLEMMGALLGHAVATGLAGLVLAVTGSFLLILALSMVFSLGGTLVILHLESSAQALIPHWEGSVPPEAGARQTGAVS